MREVSAGIPGVRFVPAGDPAALGTALADFPPGESRPQLDAAVREEFDVERWAQDVLRLYQQGGLVRAKDRREPRTPERLRFHYEIEKELAGRLRVAGKDERKRLYTELYDELFERVPDHPQWTQRDTAYRRRAIEDHVALLKPYLDRSVTFLEVGSGDCGLSFAIAEHVEQCYGVDVSTEITRHPDPPANFELLLSDGSSIPLRDGCVDVAFSNQLMEHLHFEDASEQLREIFRVLSPGGIYLCITPNRLSGPHDISRYFDRVATGFHLHEYTAAELRSAFTSAGFTGVTVLVGKNQYTVPVPGWLFGGFERGVMLLPPGIAHHRILTRLLGIKLLARKPDRKHPLTP